MNYIGNAFSPLIFGPNTREDIIPDGSTATFELVQEVPGGYEANITVLRKKYFQELLLTANDHLQIDPINNKIICTDEETAAALSQLASPLLGAYLQEKVRLFNFPDQTGVGGNPQSNNDVALNVLDIVYDGVTIEIFVDANLITDTAITQTYTGIDLWIEYESQWEVLQPEAEYTISGSNEKYHRLITFNEIPTVNDQIYVIHRGEATNNFVPTQNSVGPQQLQENLRNFVVDRYDVGGTQTNFLLSQEAVSPASIVVTVDGVVVDGDDPSQSFVGEWELLPSLTEIQFHVPLVSGNKVRILHLGFSTVSRRASFAPGQPPTVIAPGSVGTNELQASSVTAAKLSSVPPAVNTIHLQNNSVTDEKINLTLDSFLKWNSIGILSFTSANSLDIGATATEIKPLGTTNLGSLTNKFNQLFLSGAATVGSLFSDAGITANSLSVNGAADVDGLDVDGDIAVSGNVDGVDVSSLASDVSTIQGFLSTQLYPAGTIWMFAGDTAPADWLFCDGSVVSQTTYANLFAAIGDKYNTGGEPAGTFRLPNMQQRMPMGTLDMSDPDGLSNVGVTGAVLGESGGDIDHIHGLPNHRHKILHTHTIPGHYHEHDVAQGSSISVNVSGTHDTALDHTHGSLVTESDGFHEHDLSTATSLYADSQNFGGRNPVHTHTLNHTTNSESNDHTHEFDTDTDFDGTHAHDFSGVKFENASAVGSSITVYPVVSSGPSDVTGAIPVTGENGPHDHHLSGTTTQQSTGHTHTTASNTDLDGEHQHTVRGTVSNAGSNHAHTVNIPTLSQNSTSDGAHVHGSGDFVASIGNVNDSIDGNSDITTNSLTTDEVDVNDGEPVSDYIADGGPGTTAEQNPPYLVVNFIIKT